MCTSFCRLSTGSIGVDRRCSQGGKKMDASARRRWDHVHGSLGCEMKKVRGRRRGRCIDERGFFA